MKGWFAFAVLCAPACLAQPEPGDDANAQVLARYRAELAAQPNSSLLHYRIGEILAVAEHQYDAAGGEFERALSGDLQPPWTKVWSFIQLGRIYERTGQPERAREEFLLAQATGDNTGGALSEARQHLEHPHDYTLDAIKPPQIVRKTDPEYSEEGRVAGLEATATVAGIVAADSSASGWRVIEPIGLGLDEKALEAVREWRFTPATSHGAPVAGGVSVEVHFHLPANISRWHLTRVTFYPPEGASRPVFVSTAYPPGAGIGPEAIEEAQVIGAMGRPATVTIRFDIDPQGVPTNFQVTDASAELWGKQAIGVLRAWRFQPGMKNGAPVSVPCQVNLVWGPRRLSADEPALTMLKLVKPPS